MEELMKIIANMYDTQVEIYEAIERIQKNSEKLKESKTPKDYKTSRQLRSIHNKIRKSKKLFKKITENE